MELFFFPWIPSSFQFFFFPTCLLACLAHLHPTFTYFACLVPTSLFVVLLLSPSLFCQCHFAFACSLLLLPSLLTLAYVLLPIFALTIGSCLLLPSPLILTIITCSYLPIPTYFCHRHLFSPLSLAPTSLFSLTSTITTSSSTSFACLPYCLLVWTSSSPPLLSISSLFYLYKRWRVKGWQPPPIW